MLMKLLRLFKSRFARVPLAFLLSLLALVHAQAEVPLYQLAVEKMGEYTIMNQTETLDKYLNKIGFGPKLRNSIASWNSQPVIAKIEHMYWYAEAAREGSGKEAIASLSLEIARDWPTLATHSEVVKLIETELSEHPLKFRRPVTESAILDSHFHNVVLTLSSYVADGSYVTAEALLRRAGADTEAIYTSLRSSRTTKGALMNYLGTIKDMETIEKKVRIMTSFIAQTFPSAQSDAHLKPFISPDIAGPPHLGPNPRPDPDLRPGRGGGGGTAGGASARPRPRSDTGPGSGPRTGSGGPRWPNFAGCRAK